jgi:hypothetical protein
MTTKKIAVSTFNLRLIEENQSKAFDVLIWHKFLFDRAFSEMVKNYPRLLRIYTEFIKNNKYYIKEDLMNFVIMERIHFDELIHTLNENN